MLFQITNIKCIVGQRININSMACHGVVSPPLPPQIMYTVDYLFRSRWSTSSVNRLLTVPALLLLMFWTVAVDITLSPQWCLFTFVSLVSCSCYQFITIIILSMEEEIQDRMLVVHKRVTMVLIEEVYIFLTERKYRDNAT